MVTQASGSRTVAFDILRKVEAGGYASDLLLERSAPLESRDAGLASEIVFGVLRYRAQLDFLIEHYSGRGGSSMPKCASRCAWASTSSAIWSASRRTPRWRESVELVEARAQTFGRGIRECRSAQVDRDPVAWPSREVELSCPEWLLARWERHYGAKPPAASRARRSASRKNTCADRPASRISARRPSCRCWTWTRARCFLDLCAAPGNKTAQALESGVRAIACDLHYHRLAQLKHLGADLVVLDGTRPLPFARRFDRILVDAPCSGTGTLGRNPEIKWRLEPGRSRRTCRAARQALLASARAALAPGGLLVYSTCSLEPEENRDVVAEVSARTLVVETFERLPGRDPGDGFYAAVIKSEQPAND